MNVIRILDYKFNYRDPYTGAERWTLVWYHEYFYQWDGRHYRKIAEELVRSKVYELLENAVYVNIPRGANAVPTWTDFDPDSAKMGQIMQGLKDKVLINPDADMPAWLNADNNEVLDSATVSVPADPHEMIACQNVLLYTRTRQSWGHTPRYFNSYAVTYDYLPHADPPSEWLTFLKSIWPEDSESISTLQEMFGYLLTQRNDQQKMFMLYGAKRGGKGTIMRILGALMGEDNFTGTSISDLNKSDHATATLVGKQLAIMSDVRFRSRDDGTAVELLLKITGNDPVLINIKFKQQYTTHLTTRFLMASNELPRMSDESGALKGRLILLRFKESFYGREDLGLEERLKQELPGILNWALDGLDRLNARGHFVQPESGKGELETIEDLGSPGLAFIRDCFIVSPAGLTDYEDTWRVWRRWAPDNGVHPKSKLELTKSLKAAVPSIEKVRRGGKGEQRWMWEGVELSELGQRYLAEQRALEGLGGGIGGSGWLGEPTAGGASA